MKNSILSVICLLLTNTALADTASITFSNDIFAPSGQDRWLTNQVVIQYEDWAVGNDIYTPTHKRNTEIPYGDRPWDGYSYIQHTDKWTVVEGQERILTERLGVIGEGSGSKGLQRFVHDDLGLGSHPTWVGQNPTQPAIDFIYTFKTTEYLNSAIGPARLIQQYGARVGNVNDSLFLDQELNKDITRYLTIFGGLNGQIVAFNTHLDGRMFEDDVYTIDKEWFVASGRLGFKVKISNFTIGYSYKYLTEEFKGQKGRHLYGEVYLGIEL